MKMSTPLITNSFKKTKRVARQTKQESKDAGSQKNVDPKQEKELQVLKHFDLTLEFGPCSGISRLERWMRADKHGLNPPAEVKDIIEQHSEDDLYTQCLWKDYSI